MYLVTGNLGYIGPILVDMIKKETGAKVIGIDNNYFNGSNINYGYSQEMKGVNVQYYGDVRDTKLIESIIGQGVEHVIHLAAVSNDPMGTTFAKATNQINQQSSIDIAKICAEKKVSSFVYASSCSVYGAGSTYPRTEKDEVNPLTDYAHSKINTEKELGIIDLKETKVTCLRFATACGFSPNLRLDLVLNDFVFNAMNQKCIKILSDGSPWRPLIDVEDMARLLIWATKRSKGNKLEIVNAGSDTWNYQVGELAQAVVESFNDDQIDLEINANAAPDKRSYKVSFEKLNNLCEKEYLPKVTLNQSIEKLKTGIEESLDIIQKRDVEHLIRLKGLKRLISTNKVNETLNWN